MKNDNQLDALEMLDMILLDDSIENDSELSDYCDGEVTLEKDISEEQYIN